MISLMELSTEKIYTTDSEANISQKRPTYSSSNLFQFQLIWSKVVHFPNRVPGTGGEFLLTFEKSVGIYSTGRILGFGTTLYYTVVFYVFYMLKAY